MLDFKKFGDIMKKVLLWIIILVLLTATIPITAGIKYDYNPKKESKETVPSEEITLSDVEVDSVISNVMEYITEDHHPECKKILVAICKNNALVRKRHGLETITTKVSKYSDTFYKEIKELLIKDNTKIIYNNERVHIPIINISPGYIVESEEYPYISTVACPWDTQSYLYTEGYDYPCGISVYGINYLCELGFDSDYVLSYFLPRLCIK